MLLVARLGRNRKRNVAVTLQPLTLNMYSDGLGSFRSGIPLTNVPITSSPMTVSGGSVSLSTGFSKTIAGVSTTSVAGQVSTGVANSTAITGFGISSSIGSPTYRIVDSYQLSPLAVTSSVGIMSPSNIPTAPTITASRINDTTIRFTFTGGAGATSWVGYWRTPSGSGEYTEDATLVAQSTPYKDVTVASGGTADYYIAASNSAGTVNSSVATGSAGTAGYTPFYTWRTDNKTLGQSVFGNGWAVGPSATEGQFTHHYSNDIAGPHGESVIGKFVAETKASLGNPHGSPYGGQLVNGSQITSQNIQSGSHLWVRMYVYFPADFCHSYAGPDGWGRLKWWRFDWPNGNRTYIDLLQNNASCRTTTSMVGGGTEGYGNGVINPAWGNLTINGDLDYPASDALTRGRWIALQAHIYFHATAGYVEQWDGATYLGRNYMSWVFGPQHVDTWPNVEPGQIMESFRIGDYWNGGPTKQETIYFGDTIMTTQTPTTLDSGGRPYISPSTRAQDFA